MGDWGEDGGGHGTSSWYTTQAYAILDETTSGFGTFVRDLAGQDPATGRISGTIRGAVASTMMFVAVVSCYWIWRLCHLKPKTYAAKLKVQR